MTSNYYQDFFEEVKEITKKDAKQALMKIQHELSMPYIPLEVEKKLLELQSDLNSSLVKNSFIIDLESIDEGLESDQQEQQLKAIDALSHVSCRDYLEAIQCYFNRVPHENLQALLIDILIEQQINHEFDITHRGNSITFIPCYIEQAAETDGFIDAKGYLVSWFEQENPSYLSLCMQVLIEETFLMLPLSYASDEALMLALSAVHKVSNSMDDLSQFDSLIKQLGIIDYVLLC